MTSRVYTMGDGFWIDFHPCKKFCKEDICDKAVVISPGCWFQNLPLMQQQQLLSSQPATILGSQPLYIRPAEPYVQQQQVSTIAVANVQSATPMRSTFITRLFHCVKQNLYRKTLFVEKGTLVY